jgi:hypothetical protein
MNDLRTIAQHALVELHFQTTSQRWQFARYYVAQQAQSETLLSLIDTIEQFRCPYLIDQKREKSA